MSTLLENHLVLVSAADDREALEPQAEEQCVICKRTGCLVEDGWFTACWPANDGYGGLYLAGAEDELPGATDTPMGWVCSKACRSQAMYLRVSEEEKEALLKVVKACHAIQEYGEIALRVAKGATDEYLSDALPDYVEEFLKAVYEPEEPEWCFQ